MTTKIVQPIAPLWSTVQAAAYLGVPVATLHQWRYLHSGPPAYRVGRHLRYEPEAVREWVRQQTT